MTCYMHWHVMWDHVPHGPMFLVTDAGRVPPDWWDWLTNRGLWYGLIHPLWQLVNYSWSKYQCTGYTNYTSTHRPHIEFCYSPAVLCPQFDAFLVQHSNPRQKIEDRNWRLSCCRQSEKLRWQLNQSGVRWIRKLNFPKEGLFPKLPAKF